MLAEMLDAFIGEIAVDGETIKVSDLTFGEQIKLRKYIRDLSPDGDDDEASTAEMIPALVAVVKQRTDANFTLEQALELKGSDVAVPPTKPAAKKRATRA